MILRSASPTARLMVSRIALVAIAIELLPCSPAAARCEDVQTEPVREQDAVLVRRVFLDTLGQLPTTTELKGVLEESSGEARIELLGELVARRLIESSDEPGRIPERPSSRVDRDALLGRVISEAVAVCKRRVDRANRDLQRTTDPGALHAALDELERAVRAIRILVTARTREDAAARLRDVPQGLDRTSKADDRGDAALRERIREYELAFRIQTEIGADRPRAGSGARTPATDSRSEFAVAQAEAFAVRGRVVNENQEPIAGATVNIVRLTYGEKAPRPRVESFGLVRTSGDGSFAVSSLHRVWNREPRSGFILYFSTPGRAARSLVVDKSLDRPEDLNVVLPVGNDARVFVPPFHVVIESFKGIVVLEGRDGLQGYGRMSDSPTSQNKHEEL